MPNEVLYIVPSMKIIHEIQHFQLIQPEDDEVQPLT